MIEKLGTGSVSRLALAIFACGVAVIVTHHQTRGVEADADQADASANQADASSQVRQAPRLVKEGELGIGRLIPDFAFVDINDQAGSLSDFADKQAVVIAMTGTGCPLCKKYAPTLAELERHYSKRGVAFVFLNPNESESLERLREEVRTQGFQGPYIRDGREQITRPLDVKTTTEVFVLDRARTLVYRGAVDDQYGFGYSLDAPRQTYLADALDAVLDGTPPEVAATSSPGCDMFYTTDAASPELPAVTYHNRISRILQRNCLDCHRDESVAPMPLETYEQVVDYAGMIRSVVQREIMPPWFAGPLQGKHDDELPQAVWANERSLSDSEKTDLIAWVQQGAPEGDPSDAPLPKSFTEGWLIGQPDAEFEFPDAIPIKATGILPYKNVVVETDLQEDQWVRAIEVVPGDPKVVHHVLVFVLPPPDDSEREERGNGIDYWGIYVPGNRTQIYPEGFARRLPKGSRLKFQMHYTTNGQATEDKTKIGLIFADQPPRFEVKTASIVNGEFTIPPHAANHQLEESITIPSDILILGYLPHHHLRGKACRYELTTPSGEIEMLLDVPRYDFNWQLFYQYAKPKTVREGSEIKFTAWYDNSEDNPANPDPNKTVRWGQQTDDEMHVGYIEYVVPGAVPDTGSVPEGVRGRRPGGLLDRLDADRDGVITKDEVRKGMPEGVEKALRSFDRLDKNRDGRLDPAESDSLRDRS